MPRYRHNDIPHLRRSHADSGKGTHGVGKEIGNDLKRSAAGQLCDGPEESPPEIRAQLVYAVIESRLPVGADRGHLRCRSDINIQTAAVKSSAEYTYLLISDVRIHRYSRFRPGGTVFPARGKTVRDLREAKPLHAEQLKQLAVWHASRLKIVKSGRHGACDVSYVSAAEGIYHV